MSKIYEDIEDKKFDGLFEWIFPDRKLTKNEKYNLLEELGRRENSGLCGGLFFGFVFGLILGVILAKYLF